MRIQHNIAAMNSYRNYMGNNNALSKNLEKLSSGYRINRAGDDAAGLAISEKMRAQITGLDASQKNVQDGISLVKTAEGAMQEIHDMLNRMDYLATQSANGTYDNTTDRPNLQKEVEALKDEINRIADSSNFNGINLLDGSLSGDAQVKNISIESSTAVKGIYTTGEFTDTGDLKNLSTADIGKTLDYTVQWKDKTGALKSTTVSLTYQGDGTGVDDATTVGNNYFTDVAGTEYKIAGGKLTSTQLQDAIMAGLKANDEFAANFDTAKSNKSLEFTAKVDGTQGAEVIGISLSETTSLVDDSATDFAVWGDDTTTGGSIVVTKAAYDSLQKFDASKLSQGAKGETLQQLQQKIFEIDGKKFLLGDSANPLTGEQIKALGGDVNIINNVDLSDVEGIKQVAAEISRVTGVETKVFDSANADEVAPAGSGIKVDKDIVFVNDRLSLSGNSLKLQIGDSSDDYNQLKVKIGDMHTDALGINDLDISDLDGANAAIDKIRAAINSVSGVRGDLGATQNRLEHTANNLSVMEENIQNAESAIRDTDLADEMTMYTKNNILIQSAQAMLAQANQQPQGVLQLLQ